MLGQRVGKIISQHRLKSRVLLYCSAIGIGATLLSKPSSWLVYVALIPFCLYVQRIPQLTVRQIRIDFYIFGCWVSAFANLFLLEVSPSNWTMSLRGWFAVAAPIMAWLMISSFCGLASLVLGEVLRRLPSTGWRLGLLPLLFAAMEGLRSYLFAIMAYAPHGSLSPNFNWGALAVPASHTPLVYASRIVGFFGLTALVVAINVGLFLILKRRVRLGMTVLAITGVITTLGWLSMPPTPPEVAKLKIEARGLGEHESVADWQEKDWPAPGTDLLVLPEYSGLLENPDYKQILGRLSSEGLAITAIRNGRSPGGTNQLIFLNRDGQIVHRQEKTFLIPTGETLPYSLQMAFKLIGKQNAIVDFTYAQQISPGARIEQPFVYGGISYGALACSGVSALNEYSRLSRQGADILINSASLSFLRSNSRYHVYADAMARYQAISNGKPFIQASRSGHSFVLY